MQDTSHRAIAVVGIGAVMPDAPDAPTFWKNIKRGHSAISEVTKDRWDPALYYDADPRAPDKTYSKIGGWVREHPWNPTGWKLAIPPRVVDAMDEGQRWAIACTREVLIDYGYPDRPLDTERTAVIVGNAMGGEKHYRTALRISLPEYAEWLEEGVTFGELPADTRKKVVEELSRSVGGALPTITEDSMPGELSNCIAGRIANVFNMRGTNFTCDAACASALAALSAARQGLIDGSFDAVITGGIDRNMGAATFVKFCKIGALSATGSRPFADGADGFVMGEGSALFLMKRLEDAERAGDRIYAVIRGMAGSSDGKGKGITAPNPIGQRLAIERAWKDAGLRPSSGMLIEAHGTSTKVGDAVELESLKTTFGSDLQPHSMALGSVKSNIGHLKGGAGAAGLFKAMLSLHEKVLPPSLNFERPNPNFDWSGSPFYVNTELDEWKTPADRVRKASVSAFGFGGTNFHIVLEEHVPGRLTGKKVQGRGFEAETHEPSRGALLVGAPNREALRSALERVRADAVAGRLPRKGAPERADLEAPERVAIDWADAEELVGKLDKALKALASPRPTAWKPLRSRGIFRGSGPAPKVAFLFTGQGSQYANMLRSLRESDPIVRETFEEADRVMTPKLGRSLSSYVFADPADDGAIRAAEEDLKQTAITQPAVLTVDTALCRLMASRGVEPDMVMGHSLGEYGALVASGALPFPHALEAVAARGKEMSSIELDDNGKMAAVMGPVAEIERILASVTEYVVIANFNSTSQVVIGGSSAGVDAATVALKAAGMDVVQLQVSHAFHTSIVAPASEPLRRVLQNLELRAPRIPVVANVDGELYPQGPDAVEKMLDILARQVACPVQFVKGLRKAHAEGVRVFVELGPKRALHGFAEDVLGDEGDVLTLSTNHPKLSDEAAFNQALCGLYARGIGRAGERTVAVESAPEERERRTGAVTITGAALGLPGTPRVFEDDAVARILGGGQFIDAIPHRIRKQMVEKRITRLIKHENSDPVFETIGSEAEVIKLAGRAGAFDLGAEYGIPADRIEALDLTTKLAFAAGIDALRDAGIPLLQRYRTTTKGTRLPEGWALPESMQDDTGVIFASAFPGYDQLVGQLDRFHEDRARRERLAEIESLLARTRPGDPLAPELERRRAELSAEIEKKAFSFNRRFLFQVLAMGHSQFAELVHARGPNTQINSACASTTQAVSIAEDWIALGRCRRVIVVAADDITSDNLAGWLVSGFLASGAAATDDIVEEAALPFDRRRHGMIVGMGAAALVVESAEAARERGVAPIVEVLGSVTANSAFHGTRLDVDHITAVMENLVSEAEKRFSLSRAEIAKSLLFVSHETYTPARGGSAAAEIFALRHVFGPAASSVVIANTKGFTGHPMGAGIEDVLAVKSLETGIVPPVPNFKEIDPELGELNLSRGGAYPVEYALRLGAGFGSQVSMTLLRRAGSGPRAMVHSLGFETRVTDKAVFDGWLAKATGTASAELEIVHRTLRVKSDHVRPAAAEHFEKPRAVAVQPPPVRTPAPLPAPAAPAADAVAAQVLALVAQKTGYAEDMLALDLDLEADLGVDTVKQAEVFAAIRAQYDIPRDDTLKLRDYPTLGHVIGFVKKHRPDLAVAAAPVPVAVEAPVLTVDTVAAEVLALVAEKTGYAEDMLALDLDLEADLGVDTVKQAEVFAAIRARYDIPRDDALKLRDYPTLGHVIGFVKKHRPDLAVAAVAVAVPAPAPVAVAVAVPAAVAGTDEVTAEVLALVSEKTGYPEDMLALDLDLEADLGVDTVKQAEVFAAIRARYDIPRDDALKLRDYPTLGHVIGFVKKHRPDLDAARAPAAEPAPVPVTGTDEVTAEVLALVADKTGYPEDMLALDLDLEADLGVDTVKQAEVFAAIRSRYDIPRDDGLKLRDYPTLGHVIGFVKKHRPDLATAPVPVPVPEVAPETPKPSASSGYVRRVPVPVVRPELAACKPSGVGLGEPSRVIVVRDDGGVADALVRRLVERGVDVLALSSESTDELLAKVEAWRGSRPVQGVYWLPALDVEPALWELSEAAFETLARRRIRSAYALMRRLYADLEPSGAFLISATRQGGRHGYDDRGALSAFGGGVAGITKAFKRERQSALVKCVDFEAAADAELVAALLIDETLADPGAIELGHFEGLRFGVGFEVGELGDTGERPLPPNAVFVVTGAAGSITSAITADLARASGGTFYLLDLAPAPDPDDADLARFERDREGLKRELFERMKQKGERATPARVEQALAGLERRAAAARAMAAVHAAGGTASYESLDLRDAAAVERVFSRIRREVGRVDVLLHAAGLEISRLLPDKPAEEFDRVWDVKALGLHRMLRALGDMPLGAVVAMSSIAGRFGNGGQTDYSSANDFLCKALSSFRQSRPGTRGIAVDWTAWADIGMASRGSIPKMMELAGIDMLPPAIGIPAVRSELTRSGSVGEVVVAGKLGLLMAELDESGGVDPVALSARRLPMLGRLVRVGQYGELVVEATLDPREQGFLFDHRIDEVAVLPGVMGLEAFAEAASLLVPGWTVQAIEDVDFLAPFKFYRNEPRTVRVIATLTASSDGVVARCRLEGTRTLAGQGATTTTHFTATVRLAPRLEQAEPAPAPSPADVNVGAADIYRVFFHGPAYRVLERAWRLEAGAAALIAKDLPPNHQPAELPTLMAPRLIESCFQTAGIWEMGTTGKMGLPFRIDRVTTFRGSESSNGDRLYVVAVPSGQGYDARIVDDAGHVYVKLEGYRTAALPAALDQALLEPVHRAMM